MKHAEGFLVRFGSGIQQAIYCLEVILATILFLTVMVVAVTYLFFRGMLSIAIVVISTYWWTLTGRVPKSIQPRER